jgi:hypothetical protein
VQRDRVDYISAIAESQASPASEASAFSRRCCPDPQALAQFGAQAHLEALFDQSLTDTPDGVDAGVQRLGDLAVTPWKEQTLLNVVRLRYGDAPSFADMSSVISGYTFQEGLSAGASISSDLTATRRARSAWPRRRRRSHITHCRC